MFSKIYPIIHLKGFLYRYASVVPTGGSFRMPSEHYAKKIITLRLNHNRPRRYGSQHGSEELWDFSVFLLVHSLLVSCRIHNKWQRPFSRMINVRTCPKHSEMFQKDILLIGLFWNSYIWFSAENTIWSFENTGSRARPKLARSLLTSQCPLLV